jgi:hypothetical protein
MSHGLCQTNQPALHDLCAGENITVLHSQEWEAREAENYWLAAACSRGRKGMYIALL